MIATPDVGHVSRAPYAGHVYEPAEDSYVLLDALEHDADALRAVPPRLVVEIGSGSGCVSSFMTAIVGAHEAAYICTDINPLALQATRETGQRNGGEQLDVVQTNLVDAVWPRCRGHIDVLLFNPPYVPTAEAEEQAAQKRADIHGSWAGGASGTVLIDKLLPLVRSLLAQNGRFYFVAVRQNDPPALVAHLNALGLRADVCISRRAGREQLFVIRAVQS